MAHCCHHKGRKALQGRAVEAVGAELGSHMAHPSRAAGVVGAALGSHMARSSRAAGFVGTELGSHMARPCRAVEAALDRCRACQGRAAVAPRTAHACRAAEAARDSHRGHCCHHMVHMVL